MRDKASDIRQSSMFLIELIIAVFFLALCSAICIRLFVSARLTEKDSFCLTQSVTAAQNIAEVIEAGAASQPDDIELYISDIYTDAYVDGDTVTVYYDDSFARCGQLEHAYSAYITLSYQTYMISADIKIVEGDDISAVSDTDGTTDTDDSTADNDSVIYSLHVDCATDREVQHE